MEAINCGSEPARDELEGNALIQKIRVIVNVHREQARSHKMQLSFIDASGVTAL
jgi:hypothetical protein